MISGSFCLPLGYNYHAVMDDLVESNIEHDLSAVARLLAAHELPSPSQVFLEQLTNQVNREDVVRMMEAQKHM